MSEEHLVMYGKGLVTNYGEGGEVQNGRGHVKFYPYEKGGGVAEKVSFSHAEVGAQMSWGSFYVVA